MSAVTNPFINFPSSDSPNAIVNIEEVSDVQAMERRGHAGSNTPSGTEYLIILSMKRWNNTPRTIEVKYSVEATRDAAFAELISTLSTPIS